MNPQKGKIDIVNDLLDECVMAFPTSSFIISLFKHYQKYGSCSKKQLQGLYAKASTIEQISTSKLGTLEAIIKRMPTRYKSELPAPAPLFERDGQAGALIERILERYPQHKRVLYLKSKFEGNQPLTPVESSELKKFGKLLLSDP